MWRIGQEDLWSVINVSNLSPIEPFSNVNESTLAYALEPNICFEVHCLDFNHVIQSELRFDSIGLTQIGLFCREPTKMLMTTLEMRLNLEIKFVL